MTDDIIEGQMALFENSAEPKQKRSKKKADNEMPAGVAKSRDKAGNAVVKGAVQRSAKKSTRSTARKRVETARPRGTSGLVPDGDVRLTANMREDLHLRLKIAAARQRTTIGEILESLVEKYIK